MVDINFIYSKDFLDDKSKIIVNFLDGKINKEAINFFIETYMVGEEVIAYEVLCTNIYQEQIKLPKEIFLLIKEECLSWYLDFEYWMQLEDLVIGDIKKCSEIFGKVHFPKSWNEEKINQIVLNIMNDPILEKFPLTTKGELLNKDGKFSRFALNALKDGVMIRIIFEAKNRKMITYYPLYGNGVICRYLDPEDYYVE
ncbi:MAG: hypothetical protein ABIF12_00365 [bacterium]